MIIFKELMIHRKVCKVSDPSKFVETSNRSHPVLFSNSKSTLRRLLFRSIGTVQRLVPVFHCVRLKSKPEVY